MLKKYLTTTLKILFTSGLIYWLVSSGKIDFNLINVVLENPSRVIFGILLVCIIHVISTWRYIIILKHRMTKKLNFLQFLKFHWIGLFFNAVLPGSVTGDIVKVFYIQTMDKQLNKKFLFATVLLDRLVGLFGLIVVLGTFSIFNYSNLTSLSSNIKVLLDLNLAMFGCVFLGLFGLFFFQNLPKKILSPLNKVSLFKKVVSSLLSVWDSLCEFKHKMIWLTFISCIIQFLSVVTFWLVVSPFADGAFNFAHAFSIVPIGFIAIAVPIAPSGLGVGHAIFHSLFLLIGIGNGASLFNIYFLLVLLVNLAGIIPYLLNKKAIDSIEKQANTDQAT